MLLFPYLGLDSIDDKSFYQAALRGTQDDLVVLEEHSTSYSFKELKLALCAKKLTGRMMYYHEKLDEYYNDNEYEPFSEIIKRFPESSAKLLADFLKNKIDFEIRNRQLKFLGLGEIPWLKKELAQLEQRVKS